MKILNSLQRSIKVYGKKNYNLGGLWQRAGTSVAPVVQGNGRKMLISAQILVSKCKLVSGFPGLGRSQTLLELIKDLEAEGEPHLFNGALPRVWWGFLGPHEGSPEQTALPCHLCPHKPSTVPALITTCTGKAEGFPHFCRFFLGFFLLKRAVGHGNGTCEAPVAPGSGCGEPEIPGADPWQG